jgi:hypothetical protein
MATRRTTAAGAARGEQEAKGGGATTRGAKSGAKSGAKRATTTVSQEREQEREQERHEDDHEGAGEARHAREKRSRRAALHRSRTPRATQGRDPRRHKGGRAGQWSARKAQLVAHAYEAAGGGYTGGPTEAQQHLVQWEAEEWTTADGEPARRGGTTARYLPKKAWEALSPAERAATDRKKRAASRTGEQFVANTERAATARKRATTERATTKKATTKKATTKRATTRAARATSGAAAAP